MIDDDNFRDFLDPDDFETPQPEGVRPPWATDKNSSGAAYDAIQKLYTSKLRYIRNHTKKSDYKVKSNYQIFAKDVYVMAGATSTIFDNKSYTKGLKDELDAKNEALETAMERRLNQKFTSHKSKTKDILITELKETKARSEVNLEKTSEELFEMTIARIPMDLKRKLRLI
jgi:hypothetical protein